MEYVTLKRDELKSIACDASYILSCLTKGNKPSEMAIDEFEKAVEELKSMCYRKTHST